MNNAILIPAIVLGLASSLHCVGMCGPLALSLPIKSKVFNKLVLSAFIYNFGRVLTYAFLGLAVGLLGKVINLGDYQQGLCLGIAIVLILFFISPKKWRLKLSNRLDRSFFMVKLRSFWGKFMKAPKLFNFLMIGILNGFLPCGAIYIALAGALAAGSPMDSLLFMLLFGLGTIPALLAVVIAGSALKGKGSRRLRSALMPMGIVMLISLLLLRGLGLNIPYLSPSMESQEVAPHSCCDPQ